ncbi:unnamed protein product [Chrysodeixis includens]|uniref:Major facilitator superfamily (MFS) profile domain-containing protein n=1 Tax=Chrysodeixis includens TaxID=689277 RepID=A0A9P0BUW4_CHRIL|nr:unnamed protein product [Chrysodeixis includens]
MAGKLFQILGTMLICTTTVNMGVIFAWPAFTIMLFQSPNTTLHRPMTDTEISLFSSMGMIGALISTPTSGYLLDKIGRKRYCILNSLILAVVWSILTFSRRVEMVLTAIFLSGTSFTVFVVSGVYIGEICEPSIRGTMTATNMVAYGIGMLLSYLLGGYLQYEVMLYVGLSLTIAAMCLLSILKESPIHLLSKGFEKEAMLSIAFYRNLKADSKEIVEEINNLKRALNPDLDETTPEEEKLKPELKPAEKLSLWKFIKKSRSSRRAFFTNFFLMTAAISQGLVVVQIHAERLFSDAIPTVAPTLLSVFLAIAVTGAGIVAAFMTDLAGRRPLMIFASLGTGISCLVLGTQLQLHWGPTWITAVFMYIYPVMYTCGAGTVPFVLLSELFLPEVKSTFSMILVEYACLCNFVILYIFNPLLKAVGWGPVFYIFATLSFLSAGFSLFFLPETKGLNVEEIQTLFAKKRTPKNTA